MFIQIQLLIQYIIILIAIIAVIVARKELKRFIPVGLFASLYANILCYVANYLILWEFPVRVLPGVRDISFTANVVVVPVLAMFWVKYSPMSRIKWAFLWTTILTGIEYLTERYTGIITYHNGYDWYCSYILWLISWYIWYSFHKWFYKDEEPH
ncbi:hypothetical protein Ga0466249_004040 [Sporomusaceae bacterium BoRhaA]|uniref:CBO0543 family protein n=1 Tax=Pelorhabdus rhamnosifermentans TaxID=2772457 RepID=UPI001FE6CDE2|nr:CBO0543 family protein [Pelorhabdus rhamnosifermentans]MBU2702905.1 hypothetical protein [Pelorhabdus rhamnosifermentans]